MNAPQVDDVLEVPAYEYVYPSHRRNRDMKGIRPLVLSHGTVTDVFGGKRLGLGIERQDLNERLRNPFQVLTNLYRCFFQLKQRHLGDHHRVFALGHGAHEASGMVEELDVLAATEY